MDRYVHKRMARSGKLMLSEERQNFQKIYSLGPKWLFYGLNFVCFGAGGSFLGGQGPGHRSPLDLPLTKNFLRQRGQRATT